MGRAYSADLRFLGHDLVFVSMKPAAGQPDGLVDTPVAIERHQPPEEIGEGCALAGGNCLKLPLVRIGGTERDPEEDETRVVILAASDPTDRAMRTQAHGFGKAIANGALPGFQRCVVENILHSQFPLKIRSRQRIEIRPSIAFDQGPQPVRLDHLDLVAPLVEMPGHLEPSGRREPDDQAAVIL